MSTPEQPNKTDEERQQPLPPIHQVVQDMVDEAVAERPARNDESRSNYESAGRKEQA